jgi:hypothetical protein
MANAADEKEFNQQTDRNFVANESFGNAGLAEGLNPNTIKTTNAVDFRIGGQVYVKAATDNIAITAAAQAANTTAYYLVQVNAAGTVSVVKGADGSVTLPECSANNVPIGIMKIALSGGATFTAGTTDLGAANVVDTFAHINYMPAARDASVFTFA